MFKLIKFIFKLIFIILLIIIIAVGIFLFMLYDNKVVEPEYLKDNDEMQFIMNDFLSKGLEDAKINKKVELVLSEEEINIILKSLVKELNKNSIGIEVKTAYIDVIDDSKIQFISYFSAFNFDSSLKGDFSYDLIDRNLIFTFTKVSIGKINLTPKVVSNYDINDYYGAELKDSGVTLSNNSEGLIVTISLDTFKDSLIDEDAELYQTLLSVILRSENLINVTDINNNVGFSINLDSLNYDSNVDAAIPYNINFDNISEKLEKLLNNGIITTEEVDAVGTFLVSGYSKLNEEEKDIIKSVDLTSVGILIKELYTGIIEYDNYTIIDVFTNQYTGLFAGLKLTEKNWNDIFLQDDLVGQMYCFTRKEDNIYKISYIAIESIYVDINEDKLDFYLTISVNGESLVLNVSALKENSSGLNTTFKINTVRFGEVLLNDPEIKTIMNYLDNSIDEDWISIDSQNNTLSINFIGVFESSPTLSLILMIPGLNPSVKFMDGYVLIS